MPCYTTAFFFLSFFFRDTFLFLENFGTFLVVKNIVQKKLIRHRLQTEICCSPFGDVTDIFLLPIKFLILVRGKNILPQNNRSNNYFLKGFIYIFGGVSIFLLNSQHTYAHVEAFILCNLLHTFLPKFSHDASHTDILKSSKVRFRGIKF